MTVQWDNKIKMLYFIFMVIIHETRHNSFINFNVTIERNRELYNFINWVMQ